MSKIITIELFEDNSIKVSSGDCNNHDVVVGILALVELSAANRPLNMQIRHAEFIVESIIDTLGLESKKGRIKLITNIKGVNNEKIHRN